MERCRVAWMIGAIGLLYPVSLWAISGDAGDQPKESGVEVLTRGPIHEAFAEPSSYNPIKGVVIHKVPPPAVEEIPPEHRPQGGNMLWIPGYWSWDTDRDDFIWVSGIWRIPPPDRSWVPGYWTLTGDGAVWTPGFWMSSASEEMEYLPEPPESIESGPSDAPLNEDLLWSPGNWIWTDSRYVWRSGYWVPADLDWIWEPARYIWTSRGYVFVDGYWDRDLDRRGILFAPVYFEDSLYSQPNYAYSPSMVIQIGSLESALFESPNHHHYYFGDYYDPEYAKRGFRPWFEADQRHRVYDSIYAHQRWEHGRTDAHWEANVRADYDYRRQHSEARPSRTYAAQSAAPPGATERERAKPPIAAPLLDVSARPGARVHFDKIDSGTRQAVSGPGKDLAKYREQRVQWESKKEKDQAGNIQAGPAPSGNVQPGNQAPNAPVARERPSGNVQPGNQAPNAPAVRERPFVAPESSKPERIQIPRSPIVGRPAGIPGQVGNPPIRPEAPKPEGVNRDKERK